jgi:hypothetical protein
MPSNESSLGMVLNLKARVYESGRRWGIPSTGYEGLALFSTQ